MNAALPWMLEGVRVLELAEEPGWLAGKILAELGADVIKVEPPGGDHEGRRGPWLGDVPDPERSLPWLALNTSKRGITLALRSERGREIFRELARRADVVLETFRPGALEELRIGYEDLRAACPRLIWCSLTPFGRTGPFSRWRAHDLVIVALGGNAKLTGDPDRPPVRCTLPTAYLHGGAEAAAGIAMALLGRARSGRGQLVDVSLHEAQLATLVTGAGQWSLSRSTGRRSGPRMGRTREIWRARDGYVSFGLRGGPARIPSLVATVEYMAESEMAPEWLRKVDWSGYNHNELAPEEIERLETAFAAFFATRTRRELYAEALRRRILLAPCNDAGEILEQPQLRSRGFFTTLEYPELGAAIEHPAFFARSSACRIGVRGRAPRVGEHQAQVLGELGLGPAELAALAREGVI
jgi:crotonobetainyl-CoA:carnitine CoA-transferase CaiB-like acyl-CoA transferase